METLALKLPKELGTRLTLVAKRRKASKKAIAREALEQYLAHEEPTPGSVADVARKYIGCFDGPPDLSTNPKYMEGFGQC